MSGTPSCTQVERAVLDALAKRDEGVWRNIESSECKVHFQKIEDAEAFQLALARTPRSLEICPPHKRKAFVKRRAKEERP